MKKTQQSFVMTPSESKRLIAKGIAACDPVRRALNSGIVAVAKGTTNAYVAEELSGEPIDKTLYCTGTTTPSHQRSAITTSNELPDLVFRDGQVWEGVSATEAAKDMKAGDVFIKGANALNYERRQAAVLIGHPTGGTIGAVIGTLTARRSVLLIPVGLEKNIPGDLCSIARNIASEPKGSGPVLWPLNGDIFTEIEALGTLCGVDAVAIAAGGILGAEGSVRISVQGPPDSVEKTAALIAEIHGEPPFGED